MAKIIFESDENIFLEGSISFLKSSINVIQGTGYLTSKRIVFCKRSGLVFLLLGPLLMHLTKGRDIVFDVPLTDIKSIGAVKHGFGSKYVLKTSKGAEYALGFIKKDKWLLAIQQAVKNVNPSVDIKTKGDFTEFN